MNGTLDDRHRWLVPLSLAVSFIANDGEEALTMVPAMERTLGALPSWIPVPFGADGSPSVTWTWRLP